MENRFDYLYTVAELGKHASLPELQGENQILPQQSIVFLPIPPGGYTALHIAAYYGHKAFVERLLALYVHERSLDIEGRHNFLKVGDAYKNNTALHEAVRGGDHPDIVQLLLRADPTLADYRNNDCESPLFIAAENGHLNAVKELSRGTHPPFERSDGRTPLHHAMYRGHYEVVKTLLRNHKPMVKAEDIEGRTVLHVAALDSKCPEEVIEQLLERDISLNYKKDNINQQSALHIAATEGNVGVVRCILRIARRSVEMVDKDGRHALHLAVEKGHVDTVKELLKSMPRLINVLDNKGCTALDIATAVEGADDYPVEVEWTLVRYNGRRGVRKAQTNEQSSREVEKQRELAQRVVTKAQILPEPGIPDRDSDQINALSVTAVLIATLSFQAFIQPPGGVSEEARSSQQLCF